MPVTSVFTFVDDSLLMGSASDSPLRGARCRKCSAVTFPFQESCPRCTASGMTEHALARTGRLWSFTVQRFRPKPPYDGPAEFEPYAVGYVDLAGEVLVEARLVHQPGRTPRIGERLELVQTPYAEVDGVAVRTFAFSPVTEEAS